MKSKVDIVEVVSTVTNIPTLPTVVKRITDLLKMPQTSAEEVGKAITTDQALASKVLKLVNSAFYGFPGKISTITHAVVILGFSTIKNIVLSASIFETLKKGSHEHQGFDIEKFWLHSIACGAAAQTLAKHINYPDREECFIAGLVHDVGKIILCQYLPKEFAMIIQNIHDKDIMMFESEQEIFGNTHQDIGGLVTKEWNLPENLHQAVAYHHNPNREQSHYIITAIVHCADILIRAMDLGNGGDMHIPCIDEHVWQSLQLNEDVLPSLLKEIEESFDKASIFMQI